MAKSNALQPGIRGVFSIMAGIGLACVVYSGVTQRDRIAAGIIQVSSALIGIIGVQSTQAAVLAEPAAGAGRPELTPIVDASSLKYDAIGDYLAHRYHVSRRVATDIVTHAYAAGRQYAVDPLLILAVISVESSFNPVAESTMGAKGLMQVMPRYHSAKFQPLGGINVVFEPQANIQVGAQILREYLHRTGDIDDALRLYVGAASDESENGYAAKVIAERDRLYQVVHRYTSRREQVAQL